MHLQFSLDFHKIALLLFLYCNRESHPHSLAFHADTTSYKSLLKRIFEKYLHMQFPTHTCGSN